MYRKIITIFLDIDGVLNTDRTATKQSCLMDFALVEGFNLFLERQRDSETKEINISIVISSSWRDDMPQLREELERAGFRYWSLVAGRTPMFKILNRRGEQIARYIKDNRLSDKYIVIDDKMNDIKRDISPSHLIETDIERGLSERVIKELEERIKRYDSN